MLSALLALLLSVTQVDPPAKAVKIRPRAVASLEIVGPTRTPANVGFVLTAKATNVRGITWGVVPIEYGPYLVQTTDKDGTEKAIFLYALPGTYNFFAAGVTGNDEAARAVLDIHAVTVGSGPSPPGPGPQPGPGPDPSPPDPGPVPPDPGPGPGPDPVPVVFGLEALVQKWALDVVDSNKAANAKRFAAMCDTLVGMIGSGALQSTEAVTRAFEEEFAKIPTLTVKRYWRPALLAMQNKMNELATAGKLSTVKDQMQAFEELSAGLKRIK